MAPKNVCNFKENIRWSETIANIKLNHIYNFCVQVYDMDYKREVVYKMKALKLGNFSQKLNYSNTKRR